MAEYRPDAEVPLPKQPMRDGLRAIDEGLAEVESIIEREAERAARVEDAKLTELIDGLVMATYRTSGDTKALIAQRIEDAKDALHEYIAEVRAPTPVQAVREDELRADIEWLRGLARHKRWSADHCAGIAQCDPAMFDNAARAQADKDARHYTAEAERIDRVLAALDARVPDSRDARSPQDSEALRALLAEARDALPCPSKPPTLGPSWMRRDHAKKLDLIARIDAALATPDSEPSGDVPALREEIERLRALLWVRVLCGRCGHYYRYNRADDPRGDKASDEHGISHGDGAPAAPVPAPERETSDNE